MNCLKNSLLKLKTFGLCKISTIIWMKERNDFKEPDNEYADSKESNVHRSERAGEKLVSLPLIRHRMLKKAVKLQLFRLSDGIGGIYHLRGGLI